MQGIRLHYAGNQADQGPSVKVAMSGSHIKFEIPKEGIKLPSGWSLIPLVSPVVRSGTYYSHCCVELVYTVCPH